MNQSDKRLKIKKTLVNATSIIQLAKKEGMSDVELLKAIELIRDMHLKEAAAATAAHFKGDSSGNVSSGMTLSPND